MTVTIDEDRSAQFLIKKSNEIFKFLDGIEIAADSEDAILERKGEKNNEIQVGSTVQAQGAGVAAIHATGRKTEVLVSADASLAGDFGILHGGAEARVLVLGDIDAGAAGIRTTGADAHVIFKGTMIAVDAGIEMLGGHGIAQLANDGTIEAGLGVQIEGAARVENNGTIIGDGIGLRIDTLNKQSSSLTNSGIITGGDDDAISVRLGAGRDTFVNTGTLEGKVLLNGGNDRFVNAAVDALVFGGKGNDVYVIAQSIGIGELKNGGFDVVKCGSSFSAPAFVEKVILTGNGDNSLGGSSLDDTLVGNAGKNLMYGDAGTDTLTGRGGEDQFRFATGYEKDVITDFKPNVDEIYIPNWDAIESYEDLIDNHTKIDGKDIVFKAGGDSLTLVNVKFNQIDADDFVI